MADKEPVDQQKDLESLRDMHLKEEDQHDDMDKSALAEPIKKERSASVSAPGVGGDTSSSTKRQSRSPTKTTSMAPSPAAKDEPEDIVGGEVTLKLEPGKPMKLSRTSSHKVERRPPPLYFDYEDKTREATSSFTVLPECHYANKYLGATEHALECDCAEEWGKSPAITFCEYTHPNSHLT